jgi:hypothetical protein
MIDTRFPRGWQQIDKNCSFFSAIFRSRVKTSDHRRLLKASARVVI